MNVCLDLLNPLVREMIETAVKESRPFYLGVLDANGTEPEPRCAIFLEPDGGIGEYFNANDMFLTLAEPMLAADCLIAETLQGKPFTKGPMTFSGKPGPLWISKGDQMVFVRGCIRFVGELPRSA